MNWLILVIVAVVCDSIRIFLDNYTTDVYYKGHMANAQKVFFAYAHIITAVLLGLIFGIEFEKITFSSFFWFLFSGVIGSVASLAYYKALEIEDSTNLTIFVQLAPVFYLILGWLFLGETFSLTQLFAFIVILAGPLLIIFSTRKKNRKVKIRAALMASLYIFLGVVGNLIFAKMNSTADLRFTTVMALSFFGRGIGNFLIVFTKRQYFKRYHDVVKKSHGKVYRPLIWNQIMMIGKDFAYKGALVIAPAVAMASVVSDSSEPIATFILGIILTIFWPKFGREKLNKKAIIIHLIAIILVVVGVIMIQ